MTTLFQVKTTRHALMRACLFAALPCQAQASKKHLQPGIGIAVSLQNDRLVWAVGYTCIMEWLGPCVPSRAVSEEAFQTNIATFFPIPGTLFQCQSA